MGIDIKNTNDEELISELLSDKKKFDAYVYTQPHEAMAQLKGRENDSKIIEYLSQQKIKSPLDKKSLYMALFRNVATPNYEVHRFMMCADVYETLNPLILEYTEDKFVDINELKYALGKLRFYKGLDINKNSIYQYKNIIDMTKCNGKNISSAYTVWEQSLVDFHHEYLKEKIPFLASNIIDISDWLLEIGGKAKNYYKQFLSLFLNSGILFETFLFSEKEMNFNRTTILPAIIDLERQTGKRPLIVTMEPTSIEGDEFWVSYPSHSIDFIDTKLNNLLKRNNT